MTKSEFEVKKKHCPWFYRTKGEPKCSAQKERHCAKKNCAFIYWEKIRS